MSLFALGCGAGGPGGAADDDQPDGGVAVECDPLPAFSQGVSTLAGCEAAGAVDGDRASARFANPVNVAVGPDAQVYVADFDNDRIRVVDATGNVRTLVEQEGFARPFGLAFAADGTLYAQTDDNDRSEHSLMTGTIWRVDLDTGAVEVVARDLGRPRGMLVLPDGRIAISDHMHHAVRLVSPSNGAVTDLAGAFDSAGMSDARGGDARFSAPYGMALLPDGRIAVADYGNHRIRAIALDGDVTTLAGTGSPGTDDGAAATARFESPQDLAVDAAGNIYVTDTSNFVVRKIAGGEVTTVIGTGEGGWRDSDVLRDAQLYGLEGIDIAADGTTMWIADGGRGEDGPYHRIRVAQLAP